MSEKQKFEEIQIIDFKKQKKTKIKKPIEQVNLQVQQIDHDARYKQLLQRIKDMLQKNNPALAQKTKIMIKPPNITRLPKKSAITNFVEICKQLDRDENHVMNFFLSELGAEGSIAGDQLTIKNKLQQKNVESLFKKYITEFVQCQLCKSQKTILTKDKQTRLQFLDCQNCKSQRSVAPIKGTKKKN